MQDFSSEREEKGTFGRLKCICKDNIKMVFQEVEWGRSCNDVGQNRDWLRCLLNELTNQRVP